MWSELRSRTWACQIPLCRVPYRLFVPSHLVSLSFCASSPTHLATGEPGAATTQSQFHFPHTFHIFRSWLMQTFQPLPLCRSRVPEGRNGLWPSFVLSTEYRASQVWPASPGLGCMSRVSQRLLTVRSDTCTVGYSTQRQTRDPENYGIPPSFVVSPPSPSPYSMLDLDPGGR